MNNEKDMSGMDVEAIAKGLSEPEALMALADKLDELATQAVEPVRTTRSWPHAEPASPGVMSLALGIHEIAAYLRAHLAQGEPSNGQ